MRVLISLLLLVCIVELLNVSVVQCQIVSNVDVINQEQGLIMDRLNALSSFVRDSRGAIQWVDSIPTINKVRMVVQ